jgi:hypothetical protein
MEVIKGVVVFAVAAAATRKTKSVRKQKDPLAAMLAPT